MIAFDRVDVWRENNRLEFKLARGGFPKSFWETYSAFANTEGGVIVLGVEETSEGHRAIGVSNPESLIQDLWNGLNSPQRVSANLLVDSDVSIEEVHGVPIVIVKVPRADRSQRPVYINNSMNAGTYRRNGEGDYRCTMETIRSMVRDSADGAIDKEPLEEIGLDALNHDSIRGYRNEFAVIRMNHPWSGLPQEEFLLRLGAIGRSKHDGRLHPTEAGLLMFGEAWRITDAFPNYFLDCRQVSEGRRWDNRITSDSGEWSGNVYDFWNRAYLMLIEGLPRPFSLGSNMSRIDDTPQHKAVREGLTNALAHADYYGRTGVVVVRRPETVEFSNPGCLRLPIEVVEGGGVSDPRNKTLMTMFNLIGKGDKAGSGFDVFRDAAAYAGVAGPVLEEALDPDRTKLALRLELDGSRLGGASDGIATAVDVVNGGNGGLNVGTSISDVGINDGVDVGNVGMTDGIIEQTITIEKRLIQIVQQNPSMTAIQMAEALGMSARQVERVIASLKSQGKLVRIGAKRNGHWEVRP